MVGLMDSLGHGSFMVAGHDRGGRVAHRMARDHADRVSRLAVLDIAPTAAMYGQTDMRFATAYYHWFYLIQPAPLPERMIGADAEFYLAKQMRAMGAYIRCHNRCGLCGLSTLLCAAGKTSCHVRGLSRRGQHRPCS